MRLGFAFVLSLVACQGTREAPTVLRAESLAPFFARVGIERHVPAPVTRFPAKVSLPVNDGPAMLEAGDIKVSMRPRAGERWGVEARPDGLEDGVWVTTPVSELAYDVTLDGVAGLRVVDGTLEMLDAKGTPRLHVRAPIVADTSGHRVRGEVDVLGCAVDRDPAPPWGRKVVAAGSARCTVVIRWDETSIRYPFLVDPVWSTTGSLATARAKHYTWLIGSGATAKVLVSEGEDATGAWLTSSELFDPNTNTWAATGATVKLHKQGASNKWSSNGLPIILGGYNGTSILMNGEQYNVTAGTWSEFAYGSMIPRARHVSLGYYYEKPVNFAGETTGAAPSQNWDMTNNGGDGSSWWGGTGFPGTHLDAVGVSTPSWMVVIGGEGTGQGEVIRMPRSGTPSSSGVLPTSSLIVPRKDHVGGALSSGQVITAGGRTTGDVITATAEVMSTTTFIWSAVASMATPRANAAAAVVADGRFIVAGGVGSAGVLASTEAYDPLKDTWTTLGPMTTARSYHSVIELPDRRVLAIGGHTGATAVTASVEVLLSAKGDGCASDAQCASGLGCAEGVCCSTASCPVGQTCAYPGKEGDCVRRLGAECSVDVDCPSGFCTDGVCCDARCTGTCEACNLDGHVGTCTTSPSTEICSGPRCAGGFASTYGRCDGTTRTCVPGAPTACAGNLWCASDIACLVVCASDADCRSGVCLPSGACGAPTDSGVDATTDTPSADGSTETVPDSGPDVPDTTAEDATDTATEMDSASMDSASAEDAADTAVAETSTPVDAAAPMTDATPVVGNPYQRCSSPGQCATGYCVDGVCCDSPCTDRCTFCAFPESPGTCKPSPGGVDLRGDCGKVGTCVGTCGAGGACVIAGEGTQCAPSRCTGPSTGVGPAFCPSQGAKCPVEASAPFDCGAYACDEVLGACTTKCASTQECAPGFTCDVNGGQCVAEPQADSGGCAIGASPKSTFGVALAMLALLGVRRRRS